MKKRDFETYQKRFRDFEIPPKFSETHVFRGTIRHPYVYTADTEIVRRLTQAFKWIPCPFKKITISMEQSSKAKL